MPGVAFPPVRPLGLGSPPSPVLGSAKTATLPVSGRFARRSRPDTLPTSVCAWCPSRAHDLVQVPRPRQGLWSPGPPLRECDKETRGSPTFPSSPCEAMPRCCSSNNFSFFGLINFPLLCCRQAVERVRPRGAALVPPHNFSVQHTTMFVANGFPAKRRTRVDF